MTYDTFKAFYPQVLATMKSSTIAAMTDAQIESFLNDLVIRAIAAFRFPKVSLAYEAIDESGDGNIVYTFTNPSTVTQREINVLLALVKMYWLEQQKDDEELFETLYYDRDVKTFSRGNMMKSLKDNYELAKKNAKTAQYDYSRIAADGSSGLGDIYVE